MLYDVLQYLFDENDRIIEKLERLLKVPKKQGKEAKTNE